MKNHTNQVPNAFMHAQIQRQAFVYHKQKIHRKSKFGEGVDVVQKQSTCICEALGSVLTT